MMLFSFVPCTCPWCSFAYLCFKLINGLVEQGDLKGKESYDITGSAIAEARPMNDP